ncbi:Os01g0712501 [Oryza sativa Japonica Group]|uniref:Os01g0712501 protein n=2 Tax=Oryza sativa subsp. japonica TaxID=39947 RepID=B9EZ41_ORYSJ|nr:hypothetical protein OsJ_03228 [Oryza sativa Japonica Group]BAS73994.1 Os01g0712501 [Oryza sativa Japonica Group]
MWFIARQADTQADKRRLCQICLHIYVSKVTSRKIAITLCITQNLYRTYDVNQAILFLDWTTYIGSVRPGLGDISTASGGSKSPA